MSSPVSSRGIHGARSARQAPLSGRQGALSDYVTWTRQARPVDTIAVARKLAEETA
jgi:hypothetical protein